MANELTTPKVHLTLQSYDLHRREVLLRSLAREIAMDIFDLPTIMANHSLTEEDMAEISNMPSFQGMLAEYTREWNSVTSTDERVRLKMQALVEESLLEMGERLHDPEESLSAKVELFKTVLRGSGMTDKAVEGNVDRVQISINLGAGTPPIVVDHVPSPPSEDQGDVPFVLQEAAE